MSEIDRARDALIKASWNPSQVALFEALMRAIADSRPQPSAPERPARKFDAQLSFGGATQESLAPPGFRLRRRDERCPVCAVEADLPCEEPRHTIVDWRHFLVVEERPAEKCPTCGGARGSFVEREDEYRTSVAGKRGAWVPCPTCKGSGCAPRESDPSAGESHKRWMKEWAAGAAAFIAHEPDDGNVPDTGRFRTLEERCPVCHEPAFYCCVNGPEKVTWVHWIPEALPNPPPLTGNDGTGGQQAGREGSDEWFSRKAGDFLRSHAHDWVNETFSAKRERLHVELRKLLQEEHNAGRASLAKRIEAYERFVEWVRLNYGQHWAPLETRIIQLQRELSAGGTKP